MYLSARELLGSQVLEVVLSPLWQRLYEIIAVTLFTCGIFLWITGKEQQRRLSDALISAALISDGPLQTIQTWTTNIFRQLCSASLSALTYLFGSTRLSVDMIVTSAVMSCISFVLSMWRVFPIGLGLHYLMWLDEIPISFSDEPVSLASPVFEKSFSILLILFGLSLVVGRTRKYRRVWMPLSLGYIIFVVFMANLVAQEENGRALASYIQGKGYGGHLWSYGLVGIGLGVIVDVVLLVILSKVLRSLAQSANLFRIILSFVACFLLCDVLWSLFYHTNSTYFWSPLTLSWGIPITVPANRLNNYSSFSAELAIASSTNLFFILFCLCIALILAALILVRVVRYYIPLALLRLEEIEVLAVVRNGLLASGIAFAISCLTHRPLSLPNFMFGSTALLPTLSSFLSRLGRPQSK